MRYLPLPLILALGLTACGINPTQGEYGPVKYVPEQDSCWVSKRTSPTTHAMVRGLCDTKRHEWEVVGLWRY